MHTLPQPLVGGGEARLVLPEPPHPALLKDAAGGGKIGESGLERGFGPCRAQFRQECGPAGAERVGLRLMPGLECGHQHFAQRRQPLGGDGDRRSGRTDAQKIAAVQRLKLDRGEVAKGSEMRQIDNTFGLQQTRAAIAGSGSAIASSAASRAGSRRPRRGANGSTTRPPASVLRAAWSRRITRSPASAPTGPSRSICTKLVSPGPSARPFSNAARPTISSVPRWRWTGSPSRNGAAA